MGKNQRRNHRLRRQRWARAGVLSLSWEPLAPGDRAAVKQLWRLYRQNGERNGQLGERAGGLAGEPAEGPRARRGPTVSSCRMLLHASVLPSPEMHQCL